MREDIKPEKMVLAPWLPEDGLAMIAGWRGVGKTMVSLACALAIGSGEGVLGWKAPTCKRVLYVDAEMALSQMQQRIRELVSGQPELAYGVDNVFLYSHADQTNGIPNLIRYPKSRAEIEKLMATHEIEVLFLDNLSSLCNSEDENDASSWVVMQEWLLHLRREGKTVVLVHHSGKPDDHGFIKQRGSSKKEDCLNSVILLRGDGSKGFLVIYDKHRSFEPRLNHRAQMVFKNGACRIEDLQDKIDMKKMAGSLG